MDCCKCFVMRRSARELAELAAWVDSSRGFYAASKGTPDGHYYDRFEIACSVAAAAEDGSSKPTTT